MMVVDFFFYFINYIIYVIYSFHFFPTSNITKFTVHSPFHYILYHFCDNEHTHHSLLSVSAQNNAQHHTTLAHISINISSIMIMISHIIYRMLYVFRIVHNIEGVHLSNEFDRKYTTHLLQINSIQFHINM